MTTKNVTEFTPRPPAMSAASQAALVEQQRAIAEVQAAVVVAQQCPRDLSRAEAEMREACGRMALAERAFFKVINRGQGPSVHLARELARVWGNVQYGVKETRRDDAAGVSEILAFAWDVQTNTRSERSFVVPHQRMVTDKATKAQYRKPLIDLGDIYLNNQNIGARAVRECIFTVLPTYFVESAEEACRATLHHGDGKPLSERISEMVAAFASVLGVKVGQMEERLGKKRGQWDAGDVAAMRVTFLSIQRSETTVEDEFGAAPEGAKRATAETFTAPALAAEVVDAEVEPDPAPSPITDAQSRKLHALLRECGMDRDAALRWFTDRLGRDVTSSKELTKDETRGIIDALSAATSEADTLPVGGESA